MQMQMQMQVQMLRHCLFCFSPLTSLARFGALVNVKKKAHKNKTNATAHTFDWE